jgi:hypothetical protein
VVSLKTDLERTDECLPIDRFAESLTEAEQAHLRTCVRCEAEHALWQSFNDSVPAADEGAAVPWIVSELRRRQAAATPAARATWRRWLPTASWRPALGLATVMLAIAVGVLVRDPEPAVDVPEGDSQIYRGALTTLAPHGDLSAAPTGFSWVAVAGAARYDVEVLEIDRTLLWRATSPTTQIELPRRLVDQFAPGKTVMWTVSAFDAAGRRLADSGVQSFRVVVSGK